MPEQYFAGSPSVPERRRQVTARIWDRDLTFLTSAGVFSGDGLDRATDVLLRHAEPPRSGALLDLGCGWGPIACGVAVASPGVRVWAVDVNERALELTRLNAEQLGVEVTTCRPDDVPDEVRFDAIWSNPPIRVGKQALHELLLTWLPRLTDDGEARLVVGRNLGADSLQRWLTEQGWRADRVTSERGFRVLRVGRPA